MTNPKSDRSFDMHGNALSLYYEILKSIHRVQGIWTGNQCTTIVR